MKPEVLFITNYWLSQKFQIPRRSNLRPGLGRVGYVFFATGGAGYCISRALIDQMSPIAYKQFYKFGEIIHNGDDVALAGVVGHFLGVNITEIPTMNSEFDDLRNLTDAEMKEQVFKFNPSLFRHIWFHGIQFYLINSRSLLDL